MKVEDLMTKVVHACDSHASLDVAARIMWDQDCGAVPVLHDAGHVVGVITDRDICMAAFTRGQPLHTMTVTEVLSGVVQVCHAQDSVAQLQQTLRATQLRRLPVVDEVGQLLGMVTLADIALEADRQKTAKRRSVKATDLAETLIAICRPRATEAA